MRLDKYQRKKKAKLIGYIQRAPFIHSDLSEDEQESLLAMACTKHTSEVALSVNAELVCKLMYNMAVRNLKICHKIEHFYQDDVNEKVNGFETKHIRVRRFNYIMSRSELLEIIDDFEREDYDNSTWTSDKLWHGYDFTTNAYSQVGEFKFIYDKSIALNKKIYYSGNAPRRYLIDNVYSELRAELAEFLILKKNYKLK